MGGSPDWDPVVPSKEAIEASHEGRWVSQWRYRRSLGVYSGRGKLREEGEVDEIDASEDNNYEPNLDYIYRRPMDFWKGPHRWQFNINIWMFIWWLPFRGIRIFIWWPPVSGIRIFIWWPPFWRLKDIGDSTVFGIGVDAFLSLHSYLVSRGRKFVRIRKGFSVVSASLRVCYEMLTIIHTPQVH